MRAARASSVTHDARGEQRARGQCDEAKPARDEMAESHRANGLWRPERRSNRKPVHWVGLEHRRREPGQCFIRASERCEVREVGFKGLVGKTPRRQPATDTQWLPSEV